MERGAGESEEAPFGTGTDDEAAAARARQRGLMLHEAEQHADAIRDDPRIYWMERAVQDRRLGCGERLLREKYDPILTEEYFAELMEIEPPEFDKDGDPTTTEEEWEHEHARNKRDRARQEADPHGYWMEKAMKSRRSLGSNEASLRRNYGRLGLTDEDFDALMAIEPDPRHPDQWGADYLRGVEKAERDQAARQEADPHGYWLEQAEEARRGNNFTEAELRSTYGRFGLTDGDFAALMAIELSRDD